MQKIQKKKKKTKVLTIEKIKWLVVIRTRGGRPYSFPFSVKKEAKDFMKHGDFSKGRRKLYLYKITNTLVEVME
jgi:hypothetical protein